MRIFIALLFDEATKEKIAEYQKAVREISLSGNFTYYDNLHLTLLYLGEISPKTLEDITDKLREIIFKKFSYQTNKIAYFRRGENKRIVYLGIDKSYNLSSLYNLVCLKLKEISLEFPTENYTPHITLAREARFLSDQDLLEINTVPSQVQVQTLSIMESTRINGKLTYRELINIPLK